MQPRSQTRAAARLGRPRSATKTFRFPWERIVLPAIAFAAVLLLWWLIATFFTTLMPTP